MKYIKLFNESLNTNSWIDEEFTSIEEIAKLIDSYFKDHDYTDTMTSICDILVRVNDDIEWYDDLLRYDDILSSINILVNNCENPWYSAKFERFIEYLVEVQEDSQHDISVEEIEDFFLDLDYKYLITKSNIELSGKRLPSFNVEIDGVLDSDVIKLMNRFWNTVGSRLPKEFIIHKIEMERNGPKIDFIVIIIKPL